MIQKHFLGTKSVNPMFINTYSSFHSYSLATSAYPRKLNSEATSSAPPGTLLPPLMQCANTRDMRGAPRRPEMVRTVSAAPCSAPTSSRGTCGQWMGTNASRGNNWLMLQTVYDVSSMYTSRVAHKF